MPMAWYGGWKKSLFGDRHAYGEEGVCFCTWPESTPKGAEFMMPVSK